MVTPPTGPKPPAGPGKVPLTKDKVDVPVTLPSGKVVTGTVSNPKLNAIMRIVRTAWQVGGGLVCGLLAKKFNIVTSPEEVASVVTGVTLGIAGVMNFLGTVKARKAVPA
jgi:hypothetical protein